MRLSKKNKSISELQIRIVKFLLYLGQKTIFGRGQLRKKLIILINYIIGYGSIKESRFICNVNTVPFNFYNDKLTFIKIYFGRSNLDEIDFIKKNSPNKSVFIDIGSNMGFYTQFIAAIIKKKRQIKIISIDALPINNFRLKENLRLLKKKIPNIFSLVKIKNCAVGDRNTNLNLNFSYGLANAFITKNKKDIKVKCRKLINIVNEEKLKYITNLKIDIEGYEDKVLISFLRSCKKKLIPKNIILEHSEKKIWKNNLIKFLFKFGYREIFKNKSNIILNYKK
jgi:FkbM family methyltransferase